MYSTEKYNYLYTLSLVCGMESLSRPEVRASTEVRTEDSEKLSVFSLLSFLIYFP